MSTPAFTGNSHVWSSDVNEFISSKHQRFAEILNDYDPNFHLEYIPKRDRAHDDMKPFRIVSVEPNRPRHIVRDISEAEMENPQKILEWLFEGDVRRHRPDDIFARMEAKRIAAEVWNQKQEDDDEEDRQEFLAAVLRGGRDRKNWFRHNGVTYT
jgi:hypothetical protein